MALNLITKEDNFEILRDRITAILALELQRQHNLATADADISDATPWNVQVFAERSLPWEVEKNLPFINIFFLSMDYIPLKGSDPVRSQKYKSYFQIDCYANSSAKLTRNAQNTIIGHMPADETSHKSSQNTAKLVRNILMSADYEYLAIEGGRDFITTRLVERIEKRVPTIGEVNKILETNPHATSLLYCVEMDEEAPQITPLVLEGFEITIKHLEDGSIVAERHAETPIDFTT